ncbi:hypothetical protein QFC19_004205 [Naganishia cerealis]|uniref:Uncharacterized protein n=1 Tax=Naganishia cerealis TaxID=610337 RepID=A0ACC2VW04_9TREE|nr:hypothetical protein QFC19_004205 [Naganishia cerealis]
MSVKPAVRKAGPMASVTAAAGPVAPSKAPSSKAPGVSEHQQQQQQEQQQPSTGPLSIRITPSGKLYTYVRHALDHLSEHPDRPVELHTRLPIPDEEASSAPTLPPIVIPPTTASRKQNLTKTKANGPAPAPAAVALEHTRSLLPCTTSIPRLITVLEITKREYLREKSKEGRGLWQYSRFGGYSREEVGKWETQQRERRMAGAAVAGMGKGKGRGRSGKEKGEPEETREDGMDVDVSLKEPATGGAKANESAPPEGIIQSDAPTHQSDAPTHPYADADEGQEIAQQKGQEKEDRFLRDLLEGGPNQYVSSRLCSSRKRRSFVFTLTI